jgi:hypothetical protein
VGVLLHVDVRINVLAISVGPQQSAFNDPALTTRTQCRANRGRLNR